MPYPEPALSDGRISVRRWREGDVDCIRLAGTDPAIPGGTTVPATFTEADGLAFIHRQWSRAENGEGVSQAIVDADNRAVGLIWVALRPQWRVGGLGYWIIPTERGKGSATTSVRLIAPWALEALDLQRLEAWVEPENIASQRVLRRAGLEQEGRLRNFLTTAGQPADALVFSVIPREL